MPEQQILPGMEFLFPDEMELEEKNSFHNVLTSYMEVKSMMREYPKLLPRAGIVGLKIEQLLQDLDSLLAIQFRKE
jgi:hypothetical protein